MLVFLAVSIIGLLIFYFLIWVKVKDRVFSWFLRNEKLKEDRQADGVGPSPQKTQLRKLPRGQLMDFIMILDNVYLVFSSIHYSLINFKTYWVIMKASSMMVELYFSLGSFMVYKTDYDTPFSQKLMYRGLQLVRNMPRLLPPTVLIIELIFFNQIWLFKIALTVSFFWLILYRFGTFWAIYYNYHRKNTAVYNRVEDIDKEILLKKSLLLEIETEVLKTDTQKNHIARVSLFELEADKKRVSDQIKTLQDENRFYKERLDKQDDNDTFNQLLQVGMFAATVIGLIFTVKNYLLETEIGVEDEKNTEEATIRKEEQRESPLPHTFGGGAGKISRV
jgi:hypothetical protein